MASPAPALDALSEAAAAECRLLRALNPELPYAVIGSGTSMSIHGYCRMALAGAAASLVASGLAIYMVAPMLIPGLGLPERIILSLVAPPAVVLPLYLAVASALPSALYRSRGSLLEAKFLPFAMSLALLLSGGMRLPDAFRTMWERFRRDLPEFSIELDYIRTGIELGRPVDKVLMEAAMITPSPSLRALLLSLSRAARMGLYAAALAEQSIRNYLNTYAVLIEKASTSLGFLFEIYITLGLVVPIVIGITALLMAIYPVLGLNIDALIFLSAFVLVPVVSAFTLVAADSIMSRLRI